MTESGIHNPCYDPQDDIPLSKRTMHVKDTYPVPRWNWTNMFESYSDVEDDVAERIQRDNSTRNNDPPNENSEEQLNPTKWLYMLTFLSAISSFVIGYDTSVAPGVLLLVRPQFKLDSGTQASFIASTLGTAALGAIIAGIANQKWGRKSIILVGSMFTIFGTLGLAVAKNVFSLILGRIIIGLGMGLSSATVPIYIAEHAPTDIRGALVTTNTVFFTGGQLAATLIYGVLSLFDNGWRLIFGLVTLISVLQFFGFLFMPESPRWLISQGKVDDAKTVLQLVCGKYLDVKAEVTRIKDTLSESSGLLGKAPSGWSFLKNVVHNSAVRRAIIVGAMLQIFQQLTGVNNIMNYAATIIKMSGVMDDREAIWLSIIPAAVNFSFSFVVILLVDKTGKRPLILASFYGTLFGLIVLAMAFQLSSARALDVEVDSMPSVMSPCHAYDNCDPCVMDKRCGFCYISIGYFGERGSCLPTAKDDTVLDTKRSEYGRCHNTTSSASSRITWAYEYCPTDVGWIAFLALIIYTAFFAMGAGPLPWTINAEIYPLWARSFGNSISTTSHWITNLVVSTTFLMLSEKMTRYGVFYLYGGFTVLGIIFIYLFLPETKGNTLENIEEVFEGPWLIRKKKTHANHLISINDPIPHSETAQHFPQNTVRDRYPRLSYGQNGERVIRLDDMQLRPHMDYQPGQRNTFYDESET